MKTCHNSQPESTARHGLHIPDIRARHATTKLRNRTTLIHTKPLARTHNNTPLVDNKKQNAYSSSVHFAHNQKEHIMDNQTILISALEVYIASLERAYQKNLKTNLHGIADQYKTCRDDALKLQHQIREGQLPLDMVSPSTLKNK